MQALQHLAHKEVSRKEFLSIAGLAVLSVFGFSTVIKLLTGKSLEGYRRSLHDYGPATYGGTNSKADQ